MAKVKDGKIIKDDKKEKTNFLGGKTPFSIKKGKTLKQQRSDIIKGRADRLKSDAKKQGISVEQLKKKRSDTYSTVLSPLTFLPIGKGISLAGKAGSNISKFLKGSDKVKKSTKVADKVKNVKTPSTSTSGTKFSKKTTKNTKTNKTTKTAKNNKKTKVTPTTVTKPKQGPFPKVYNRPVGPNPKTSTRITNFVKKNKVPIIAGATAVGTGTALLSGDKSKDKNKKKKDFGLGGTDQIKKPSVKQGPPKGPLKPKKDYTGKFVNEKGEVAYDSVGDFFRNITGTAKKRARPENRKRIQSATKGATKGIGFSGKSAGNPFKFNSGGKMVKRAAGGLKPVPEGNKGLGKLPQPVRNKMGYMKKGGIVKMRGGGAATRGMNFNRGY
tara:strand:+ start:109 stop:1257 length:1149 start_codon:yes stop_codon:yes gene_type:complete